MMTNMKQKHYILFFLSACILLFNILLSDINIKSVIYLFSSIVLHFSIINDNKSLLTRAVTCSLFRVVISYFPFLYSPVNISPKSRSTLLLHWLIHSFKY